LNVGTEYFKGPSELRVADETLKTWKQIDYKGFIEASEVFKGHVDVVVTDGFTGNSVIKSSEGALDLAFSILKTRLSQGIFKRILGLWLKAEMKQALRPLDPREANGALLAGSDLLVIKSHGNAKEKSFYSALNRAALAHDAGYVSAIWRKLDNLFDEDLDRPG
jgi:glycerol-3-phosphate acyltransferase PlsX